MNTTLQINQKDYQLQVIGKRLKVQHTESLSEPVFLPLRSIKRILLTARGSIDTSLLLKLQELDISLVIISPKSRNSLAVAVPKHGDIKRRIYQAELLKNLPQRIALSKLIIHKKIQGYINFLIEKKSQRHDIRLSIHQTIEKLVTLQNNLGSEEINSLNAVRGIEGIATLCWFKVFQLFFANSLHFTNRNRRPPKDPVNALLSLSYSMLYHECNNALVASGLDPDIGYLHDISHNRHSLACDKMEAFRPAVDVFVYDLFRTRELREHNFNKNTQEGDACYLDKEGKAIFYPQWKSFAETLQLQLQEQTTHYVNTLESINE